MVEYCREVGFTELFFYTDICDYYEKTEWEYLENGIEYLGEYLKIYKKEIPNDKDNI